MCVYVHTHGYVPMSPCVCTCIYTCVCDHVSMFDVYKCMYTTLEHERVQKCFPPQVTRTRHATGPRGRDAAGVPQARGHCGNSGVPLARDSAGTGPLVRGRLVGPRHHPLRVPHGLATLHRRHSRKGPCVLTCRMSVCPSVSSAIVTKAHR